MSASRVDVVVIGGGILGLATAHALLARFPGRSVTLLEKEPGLARHQSGRNSGVLHSGIYYKPGSLKARTCREGKRAMETFCATEGIPYAICGKVIVARTPAEIPRLERIQERGQANGVRCDRIGPEQLRELEPHAAGVGGLHVPETGIVDYPAVCQRLAERIARGGGAVRTGARVVALARGTDGLVVRLADGDEVVAGFAINCAGLHSDRLVALAGVAPEARIIPFRGEYYKLRAAAETLCKNLIYPVPDPAFPFLGVHFTRRIGGGVECGPNAVLAFAREGYTRSTVDARDLRETLTYPGFLRLAARHGATGLGEMLRSVSRAAFAHALGRLVPAVRAEDLEPMPAGVRAQAVRPSGELVDDFLIQESERMVHVCNAPSPAATASLAIAAVIVERVAARLAP